MNLAANDFEILPASASLRREALEMVLQEVPAARRGAHIAGLLAAEQAGRMDLSGLLIARQAGHLWGTVWAQVQPGAWPVFGPRSPRTKYLHRAHDALLAAIVEWLGRQDVRLAQILLAVDASRQRTQLAAQGFEHLADLFYMVCPAAGLPNHEPETSLQFESVSSTAPRGWPRSSSALTNERSTAHSSTACGDITDVLAGYRACGDVRSATLVDRRRGESDVGCLLLADHAAEDQWEIVYAGLVPDARGRSYGLSMSRHAR